MKRFELAFGLILLAVGGSARAEEGTAANPGAAKAAPAARTGKAGIKWVSLPGGAFTMGSADADLARARPLHRVTVKSFQITKTLVTNKQYKACVAAGACTPAHASDGTCYINNGGGWSQGSLPEAFQGDDQPAVCVDWEQAQVFAHWADGRLPTEAEWEYAARGAGRKQAYPWGNEKADCSRAVASGCGITATAPVCSKPAGSTPQGLCDMAGNAWEWVADGAHDTYAGAPTDGSAWAGAYRIFRGGAWDWDLGNVRAAVRYFYGPDRRNNDFGFRLAR
jgi:formylglycine-generating enzyme required for sulfatase activity